MRRKNNFFYQSLIVSLFILFTSGSGQTAEKKALFEFIPIPPPGRNAPQKAFPIARIKKITGTASIESFQFTILSDQKLKKRIWWNQLHFGKYWIWFADIKDAKNYRKYRSRRFKNNPLILKIASSQYRKDVVRIALTLKKEITLVPTFSGNNFFISYSSSAETQPISKIDPVQPEQKSRNTPTPKDTQALLPIKQSAKKQVAKNIQGINYKTKKAVSILIPKKPPAAMPAVKKETISKKKIKKRRPRPKKSKVIENKVIIRSATKKESLLSTPWEIKSIQILIFLYLISFLYFALQFRKIKTLFKKRNPESNSPAPDEEILVRHISDFLMEEEKKTEERNSQWKKQFSSEVREEFKSQKDFFNQQLKTISTQLSVIQDISNPVSIPEDEEGIEAFTPADESLNETEEKLENLQKKLISSQTEAIKKEKEFNQLFSEKEALHEILSLSYSDDRSLEDKIYGLLSFINKKLRLTHTALWIEENNKTYQVFDLEKHFHHGTIDALPQGPLRNCLNTREEYTGNGEPEFPFWICPIFAFHPVTAPSSPKTAVGLFSTHALKKNTSLSDEEKGLIRQILSIFRYSLSPISKKPEKSGDEKYIAQSMEALTLLFSPGNPVEKMKKWIKANKEAIGASYWAFTQESDQNIVWEMDAKIPKKLQKDIKKIWDSQLRSTRKNGQSVWIPVLEKSPHYLNSDQALKDFSFLTIPARGTKNAGKNLDPNQICWSFHFAGPQENFQRTYEKNALSQLSKIGEYVIKVCGL